MLTRKTDVVVIGAGIAGITASIYLKRAGVDVILLDMNAPGGQLLNINSIENYPGFSQINGSTLAWQLYEQTMKLEIPFYIEEVVDIKNDSDKTILTNKSTITCKGIILASGRAMRTIGLENEQQYRGKGLSFCATCDGALYKDKVVCILGDDKNEINYLKNLCKKVIVLSPNTNCTFDEKTNVEIIKKAKVEKLCGRDKLESIVVNGQEIITSALFINLEAVPSISYLKNLPLEKDKQYLVVDNNMKTNIDGIYACGDLIKKDLYQLLTAASEGAIAATHLRKYLKK